MEFGFLSDYGGMMNVLITAGVNSFLWSQSHLIFSVPSGLSHILLLLNLIVGAANFGIFPSMDYGVLTLLMIYLRSRSS